MGVVLLLMERCWRGRRPSGRNLAASLALGGREAGRCVLVRCGGAICCCCFALLGSDVPLEAAPAMLCRLWSSARQRSAMLCRSLELGLPAL